LRAVALCIFAQTWIYEMEPWKIKGEDREAKCGPILRTAVEAIYILAHFFEPFIPDASEAIQVLIGSLVW